MSRSKARLAGPPRASAAALIAALVLASPSAAQQAASEGAPAAPPRPDYSELERSFESLVESRRAGNKRSAEVQAKIDEVADETDVLAAQHRNTLKQVASIRQFNDRMRELIASQEAELASVAEQLNRVEEVGRSVTPLMLRMIDALEAFVALDVPFLPTERSERIAGLRELMLRSDVTNSTKFRQIMEAYQIENEYGRTIEAYRDEIEIDGKRATVDVLRFGRVALLYQTLDESHTAVWSQQERRWDTLPASYTTAVDKGVKIARKLLPPDLIELPLPPPEGAGAAATQTAAE